MLPYIFILLICLLPGCCGLLHKKCSHTGSSHILIDTRPTLEIKDHPDAGDLLDITDSPSLDELPLDNLDPEVNNEIKEDIVSLVIKSPINSSKKETKIDTISKNTSHNNSKNILVSNKLSQDELDVLFDDIY